MLYGAAVIKTRSAPSPQPKRKKKKESTQINRRKMNDHETPMSGKMDDSCLRLLTVFTFDFLINAGDLMCLLILSIAIMSLLAGFAARLCPILC